MSYIFYFPFTHNLMYYEAGKLSQPILIINILNYPIQNINNLLMIALSNLFKVSLLLNILLKSKACSTGCLNCMGVTCSECLPTRKPSSTGSDCICENGYGEYDPIIDLCGACHQTCLTCTSENNSQACLSCDSDLHRELDGNKCSCAETFFEAGSDCLPCHNSCLTCSQPLKCDSCPSGQSLYPSNNLCACNEGTAMDPISNICRTCHYSCSGFCIQTNYLICYDCSSADKRVMISGSCNCDLGYYDLENTAECQPCHSTCQTCDGPESSNCLSCYDFVVSQRHYQIETKSCVCDTAYRFDVNNVCENCHYSCQSCNISGPGGCAECNLLMQRVMDNNYCRCKIGYFDVGVHLCQECHHSCVKCEEIATKCVQCDQTLNRALDKGSCVCKIKTTVVEISYYENPTTQFCELCHPSCLTCNGNQASQCLSCFELDNRELQGSTCLCKQSYLEIGNECFACDFRCQTCFDFLVQCVSCPPGTNRLHDPNTKSCLCSEGYFDDNIHSACAPCHSSCKECATISNKCLSCKPEHNTYYDSLLFKCKCNPGSYFDNILGCTPCDIGCATCKAFDFCLTCNTNSNRQLVDNRCNCQPGFFTDGQITCQPCVYPCTECIFQNNRCTKCQPEIFLVPDQQGACVCQLGYYDIGGLQCEICHYTCNSCVIAPTYCLTCDLNLMRNPMAGCPCNDGYYDIGVPMCSKCDITCRTCETSSSFCTTCNFQDQKRVLLNHSCICANGFWQDEWGVCKSCSQGCLLCQSQLICTVVDTDNGYVMVNDQPTCHGTRQLIGNGYPCLCRTHYAEQNPKALDCQICHSQCQDCTEPQQFDKCSSCWPDSNRRLSNSICICNDEFYEDGSDQCKPCHWSCKSCLNGQTCQTCHSGMDLLPTTQLCQCQEFTAWNFSHRSCVPCQYRCEKCNPVEASSCVSCLPQNFRSLVGTRCDCHPEYYEAPNNPVCQKCHFSCSRCFQGCESCCTNCGNPAMTFRVLEGRKCVCIDGYGFQQGQKECEPCNVTCLTCSLVDQCTSCNPNHFRERLSNQCVCMENYRAVIVAGYEEPVCSKCHQSCSRCDGPNEYDCLACTSSFQRYYQAASKQCLCQPFYFDDGKSSVCQPCHYSCNSCIDSPASSCTACPSTRVQTASTPTFNCVCASNNLVDDGRSKPCMPCHYSCKTCSGVNFDSCSSCETRIFNNGVCECQTGFYDDSNSEICKACHYTCATCYEGSALNCLTCDMASNRILLGNRCPCKYHFMEDPFTKKCVECNYSCETCAGAPSQCTSCLMNSGRLLDQQKLKCPCPASLPLDISGDPIQCHHSCETCNLPGPQGCTSCGFETMRYFVSAKKECPCMTGYFDADDQFCQSCSQTCQTCAGDQGSCLSCHSSQNRILVNTSCECLFRTETRPTIAHYSRLDSYDYNCFPCHYSCSQCKGPNQNQCTQCLASEFRSLNANHECACLSSYIDLGQFACQQCLYSCATCEQFREKCVSCPSGSMRFFNSSTFSCDCSQGYFDDGFSANCIPCDQNCLTCWGVSTKCTSCDASKSRLLNTINSSCSCMPGYYDAVTFCQKCHYSCRTCSGPSKTECLTCNPGLSSYRYLNLTQCLCFDGYFDVFGDSICHKCNQICLTCSESESSCSSCNAQHYRTLKSGICDCQDGYFDNGSTICVPCAATCKTCQGLSTDCKSCPNGALRVLKANKRCECQDGYFELPNLIVCAACSYSCKRCQDTPTNCTSCESLHYRVQSGSSCPCIMGMLDVGMPECQLCIRKCQTCGPSTFECLTCDSMQNRVKVGSNCRCLDGFYEDSVTENCVKCSAFCSTCVLTSQTCTSCDITRGKVLIGNECLCPQGQFINLATNFCQNCPFQCQTCSNGTTCLSCNSTRLLIGTQCQCKAGFLEVNQANCQSKVISKLGCSNKCATCATQATRCTSCFGELQRQLFQTQCLCRAGFFDSTSGSACYPCHYSCLECVDFANNCTKCQSTQFRKLVKGSCDCIDGYFDNGVAICYRCDYSCATCQGSDTRCTSCKTGATFRLDQSKFNQQCPCLPGFYDDGVSTCAKCNIKCATCSSKNHCITCNIIARTRRVNSPPNCPCELGYFDDGLKLQCQQCSKSCLTCISDSSNCLECKGFKRSSPPLCFCPNGYFDDGISFDCQVCQINCETCFGNSSKCLTCNVGRSGQSCTCPIGQFEAFKEFCQDCALRCLSCAQKAEQCLICKGDRINPPFCLCKEGYYDDRKSHNCIPCHYTCSLCNETTCFKCAGNREPQQGTSECMCPPWSVSYLTTPYCSNCQVAVVSIIFENSLEEIAVNFDFPIQINTKILVESQGCSMILEKETLDLIGKNPICKSSVLSPNQLIISLGESSSLDVGSFVTFQFNSISHTHCDKSLGLFIFNQVKPPAKINEPAVKILAPTDPQTPCSEIEVSYRDVQLNGKRPLKSLLWSFVGSTISSDIFNFKLLHDVLQQHNQAQQNTLVLPAYTLPIGSINKFSLEFSNFLGIYSTRQFNLTIGDGSTIILKFDQIHANIKVWENTMLSIYYRNRRCLNGIVEEINNPLMVIIRETNKWPRETKGIEEYSTTTEKVSGFIQFAIPSYSLEVASTHILTATAIDTIVGSQTIQSLEIQVSSGDLIAKIKYGSRIEDYRVGFLVEVQAKDLNIQQDWSIDNSITYEIECIDVALRSPCVDQFNNVIKLNYSSSFANIKPQITKPYSVQLWNGYASKDNLRASCQALIIILDSLMPKADLDFSSSYLLREVNINEEISIKVNLNQGLLQEHFFTIGMVYNFEQVGVIEFESNHLKFRIWDRFANFISGNQLSVRVQSYNINFMIPESTTLNLKVNLPPKSAVFIVSPSERLVSLSTAVNMTIRGAYDIDVPLTFQFGIYKSSIDCQEDESRGTQLNILFLSPPLRNNQITAYLPQFQRKAFLIALISDSKGSLANITKEIELEPLVTQDSADCLSEFNIEALSLFELQTFVFEITSLLETLNEADFPLCLPKLWEMVDIATKSFQRSYLIVNDEFQQSLITQNLRIISEFTKVNHRSSRITQQSQIRESYTCISPGFKRKILVEDTNFERINSEIGQLQVHIESNLNLFTELKSSFSKEFSSLSDSQQRRFQQVQMIRQNSITIIDMMMKEIITISDHEQRIPLYEKTLKIFDLVVSNFADETSVNGMPVIFKAESLSLKIFKLTYIKLLDELVQFFKDEDSISQIENNLKIERAFEVILAKFSENPYSYSTEPIGPKSISKHSTLYSELLAITSVPVFVPRITQHLPNQIIPLAKLGLYRIAFNMQIFLRYCLPEQLAELSRDGLTIEPVCVQFIDTSWRKSGCILTETKSNQSGYFPQCLCELLHPTTLMYLKTQIINDGSNQTLNQTGLRFDLQKFRVNFRICPQLYLYLGICALFLLLLIPAILKDKADRNSILQYATVLSSPTQHPVEKDRHLKMNPTNQEIFARSKYLIEIYGLLFLYDEIYTRPARLLFLQSNLLFLVSMSQLFAQYSNILISTLILIPIYPIHLFIFKVIKGVMQLKNQSSRVVAYTLTLSLCLTYLLIVFLEYSEGATFSTQSWLISFGISIGSCYLLWHVLLIPIQIKLFYITSFNLLYDKFHPVWNFVYFFVYNSMLDRLLRDEHEIIN